MQGFRSKDSISMKAGRVFISGEEKTNTVSANIVFAINTAEVATLGNRGMGDKQISYKITGTLNEYKATKWLYDYCKAFQNGENLEPFDIQGVVEDKQSYYYRENGTDRITVKGCILTGDIPIFNMDAEGEVARDEISFTAELLI